MSEELFRNLRNADAAFEGVPRYNASPMQMLPVLAMRDGDVRAEKMLWWLIPHHSKDGKPIKDKEGVPLKTFNAKGETLVESRLYAPYFTSARCLIPVDAFYEWRTISSGDRGSAKPVKQPMAIRMKDRSSFMFAGLFSVWKDEAGNDHPSFTIITTEPNELMATIHRRMPVILDAQDHDAWLDRENRRVEELKKLIRPYDASAMEAFPVSTFVNNSRNEGPECLLPPDDTTPQTPPRRTTDERRLPKR